jgi:hypothetical protein
MITEFDEQSNTKEEALKIFKEKVIEYYKGLETFGVVAAYEHAARRKGITIYEIDRIYQELKDIKNDNT